MPHTRGKSVRVRCYNDRMKKILWVIAAIVVVVLIGTFIGLRLQTGGQRSGVTDYKNATYDIEGNLVTLSNGGAEQTVQGSSATLTTKLFGNEATGDLNGDGIPDIAFLLTQDAGGSGTFYYVVAAVHNADGTWRGTNGVFLGDRIAPQTTQIQNGQLIVNYADRPAGAPMTARASEGKSMYLKLDSSMQLVPAAQ
jgi:hypothetical protein